MPREAYGSVGEALLWTLDYGLGEAFTLDMSQSSQLATDYTVMNAAVNGNAPMARVR